MLQWLSQALPMVVKCQIMYSLKTDKIYIVLKNE